MTPDFWKTKSLAEMTPAEWDALCARCGLCCLQKYEDAVSGDTHFSSLTCPFLNSADCRCLVYPDRHSLNPFCIELSSDLLPHWLPDSCAYRLVAGGCDLPSWHHLVCGDPGAVHQVDSALQDKTVSDLDVDLLGRPPVTLFRVSKYHP